MRLGLMIPCVNTIAEGEFHDGATGDVTVHTARMAVTGTAPEDLHAMIADGLPRAAKDLGAIRPDVVVLGCTAAGAVLGAEGEQRLARQIEEWSGAPVVSMNHAVQTMLARTRARRVALVTPYPDDVTQQVAAGLRVAGMEVPIAVGMGFEDAFDIAAVTADEVVAFVERHVRPGDADALFLSCGNLRTLDVRDRLSEQLGIPVVASNLAALELALETLGA